MGATSGCGVFGGSILNPEPFVDTVTDESGNVLSADTERNWRDWSEIMERHIARESQGGRPNGYNDWEVFWASIFAALEKSQQNYERYVAYILERRAQKGLPELNRGP